jgi:hypothetical protein
MLTVDSVSIYVLIVPCNDVTGIVINIFQAFLFCSVSHYDGVGNN